MMPVEEIAKMVHEKVRRHLSRGCDPGFGKYRIYPKKWESIFLQSADIRSTDQRVSDFCTSMRKSRIIPQILGGGQQTVCVPERIMYLGIAGLGVATGQIYKNLDENVEHMYQLKEHIAEGLSR